MNNVDLCKEYIQELSEDFGDLCIRIKPEDLKAVITKLNFNMLISVTAVDFLDTRDQRFDMIYHLLNLDTLERLRIKAAVSKDKPEIDSLTEFYQSANFMEREVWDMYGIKFSGHPDLRRILMYPEFKGHPLRKDYPLQGKQPRIKLRHPEVQNTARNMKRPELVQIGRKS